MPSPGRYPTTHPSLDRELRERIGNLLKKSIEMTMTTDPGAYPLRAGVAAPERVASRALNGFEPHELDSIAGDS